LIAANDGGAHAAVCLVSRLEPARAADGFVALRSRISARIV
jgi:hypothetical protein